MVEDEPIGDAPLGRLVASSLLSVPAGEDGGNGEDTTALGKSVSMLYRLGLAVPKTMDMDAEINPVALATAGAWWMMAVVTSELTINVVGLGE